METALDHSANLTAVKERAREEDCTGNFQTAVQSQGCSWQANGVFLSHSCLLRCPHLME